MINLQRRFAGLAALLAAIALPTQAIDAAEAPAAAPTQAAAAPSPAIWLLADDDTRIYLFGTVHLLPPGLNWRSADLDRIVAEADELVLEIAEDPTVDDPDALVGPMLMGKQVPILSRVSPERREPLRELLEATGIPLETFDGMQTWGVALMLAADSIGQAYATDEVPAEALTGVEDALRDDFHRDGRPISGVETVDQQLGFFSRMGLSGQRAFLEKTIDSYVAGEEAFDPEEQGWVSGDVEAIAAEMEQLPPELYALLLTRRNAYWTGWLAERLERPGTVLFAVGAGHLAGRDSVQAMLAGRGLTVTRLD